MITRTAASALARAVLRASTATSQRAIHISSRPLRTVLPSFDERDVTRLTQPSLRIDPASRHRLSMPGDAEYERSKGATMKMTTADQPVSSSVINLGATPNGPATTSDPLASPPGDPAPSVNKSVPEDLNTRSPIPSSMSTTPEGLHNKYRSKNEKMKSIVELIVEDHEAIKVLYEDYLKCVSSDAKQQKVYAIIAEISKHSASEELVLYPFIRDKMTNGANLVKEPLSEYVQIKKNLKRLDKMKVGDVELDSLLLQVMSDFELHIDRIERDLLPVLSSKCTRAQLFDLGEMFINANTVVSSRPHPAVPTEGIAGVAAHMFVKPIDKMRDIIDGRDKTVAEQAAYAKAQVESKKKKVNVEKGEAMKGSSNKPNSSGVVSE